jgi:hypothetical protein
MDRSFASFHDSFDKTVRLFTDSVTWVEEMALSLRKAFRRSAQRFSRGAMSPNAAAGHAAEGPVREAGQGMRCRPRARA